MKLNYLFIEEYKLLKDFKINFKKDISILIGINGSGKSSILETIAQIFSDAILKQKSKFGFKIDYELRLEETLEETATTAEFKTEYIRVEIFANKDGEQSYKVYSGKDIIEKVDDIEKRFGNFEKILPSNIVIYYSGLSEIMKGICEPHDRLLSKNYREGNKTPSRPFFYFEPALFDIILITLLSYEFGDIPVFLQRIAKIKELQSLRIRLKKPVWARQKVDSWWGARGEVKSFFDFLNSKMDNGLVLGSMLTKDFSKGNIVVEAYADEYLIITIITQNKLFEVREHFTEEKALFKILNTLYIDGLWHDAEFSFIKHEDDVLSSFGLLSEGEQQAITIKGLTELVTSENTLFLFDEPDTYLHPSWQRTFIESLIEFIEKNETAMSQFLVTTHSPQLLSNANPEKSEVQIMEDGEIVEITPKYYGKDISQILYEMMGVEGRNRKVAKELNILFTLIEDEKLEEAKLEFQKLSELLGDTDPAIVRAKTQLDYLQESTK